MLDNKFMEYAMYKFIRKCVVSSFVWLFEPVIKYINASGLEQLWIAFYVVFCIISVAVITPTPKNAIMYGLLWTTFSAYISSKQPYVFLETKDNIKKICKIDKNRNDFYKNDETYISGIVIKLINNALLSVRTLFAITFFLLGLYYLDKGVGQLIYILIGFFAYRSVFYTIKNIDFNPIPAADIINKEIEKTPNINMKRGIAKL